MQRRRHRRARRLGHAGARAWRGREECEPAAAECERGRPTYLCVLGNRHRRQDGLVDGTLVEFDCPFEGLALRA